jgi:SAM-dependent methyltransferase
MLEIRHSNTGSPTAARDAYNQLLRGEALSHHDSFYLWLISLLKPPKGSRLIDISCGQGRLVYFSLKSGIPSIGVDFAISGIRHGKQETPGAGWLVGDGECLPLPPACADYVTHIGSLEHYQDPQAGMREIARLLKPAGVACILLPNSYGLVGNIKHVWKTGDIFDDGQPLQRYNSPGGWRNLLVKNGLLPFRTIKFERPWPRTRADLIWYLSHPSKLLRLFAAWFIPLNLANCIVYLCRRSGESR